MIAPIGAIIDFHGRSAEVLAHSDEPHGAWLMYLDRSLRSGEGNKGLSRGEGFYCPDISARPTILAPEERSPLYGMYPRDGRQEAAR